MSRFFCDNLASASPHARADGTPPRLSGPDAPWQEVDAFLVELDRDEAAHGRRVLRLDIGAAVELFDGQGTTARGVVEAWQPRAAIRVTALRRDRKPRPHVTLAVCLPKGPRTDQLVAALSQLGVDTLVPLRTARSVVDPRETKLDRLRRACIESAKQCGRSWLMDVAATADLGDLLHQPADLRLIADPPELPPETPPAQARPCESSSLAGMPEPALTAAEAALVLIGPEGGWTDEERTAARDAGFAPWSLGPHVMRIETAATAAAAMLAYHGKMCGPRSVP